MGRKSIEQQSVETMFALVSTMFVPENILIDFEIFGASKVSGNWVIELREKKDRAPIELEGDAVLDGFCNAIEILSHGFSAGPVYLKIYRRRWKKSNQDTHYSNKYDFTLKGFRMVPELGIFLKEEDRRLSR